jgi:hypothetical protein
VTNSYRDALGDAATPEDARAVIDGAISGLRDIETEPPVADRIDGLADALASLLESVQGGRRRRSCSPRPPRSARRRRPCPRPAAAPARSGEAAVVRRSAGVQDAEVRSG